MRTDLGLSQSGPIPIPAASAGGEAIIQRHDVDMQGINPDVWLKVRASSDAPPGFCTVQLDRRECLAWMAGWNIPLERLMFEQELYQLAFPMNCSPENELHLQSGPLTNAQAVMELVIRIDMQVRHLFRRKGLRKDSYMAVDGRKPQVQTMSLALSGTVPASSAAL